MVTSLAALAAASVSTARSPFSTTKKLAKSTPPRARPMGGIRTSLTSELTIPVKEAPMITPTAKSTTLPRTANFLNSEIRDMGSNLSWDRKAKRAARRQQARAGSSGQFGARHRAPRQRQTEGKAQMG